MQLSRAIFCMLLIANWANIAAAQPTNEKLAAEADPAIQAQIRAVYDAKSEAEAVEQLEKLKRINDDKAQLVKQLAIFAVVAPNKKEMHDLLTVVILHRLEFSPSFAIRVLAPYLGSDNEQLRGFAHQWFESHDRLSNDPLEPGNYKDYADYIGHRLATDGDIPDAFIEYMFQRAPERALLAFCRGSRARHLIPRIEAISRRLRIAKQQGRLESGEMEAGETPPIGLDESPKEILLAGHVVSNAIWLKGNKFDEQFQEASPRAKEQLAKLARHSEFWVRLYVAEIMRRHRELQLPDVLEKLRDDDHELVSKAARSVKG